MNKSKVNSNIRTGLMIKKKYLLAWTNLRNAKSHYSNEISDFSTII